MWNIMEMVKRAEHTQKHDRWATCKLTAQQHLECEENDDREAGWMTVIASGKCCDTFLSF